MYGRFLVSVAAVLFALTSIAGTGAAREPPTVPDCVTVFDFPDAGEKLCFDADGPCFVREIRTTFTGTEERCLVGHD